MSPRFAHSRLQIVSLISCILAVFFAFFTGAMFCDQWEAMTTNTTGVESLKEVRFEAG